MAKDNKIFTRLDDEELMILDRLVLELRESLINGEKEIRGRSSALRYMVHAFDRMSIQKEAHEKETV